MKNLTLQMLFALLLVAGVFGCGGASKTGAQKSSSVSDTDVAVSDTAGDGMDASTGDAVPTGPGIKATEQHEMLVDARGAYNDGVRAGAQGNVAAAEAAFQRALKIDPDAFQTLYNLGVVCERQGDDECAEKHYENALKKQPDYVTAMDALYRLHVRRGNSAAAVNLMFAKASDYPANIHVLTRYADALIAARRYSDAIDVAKRALRLDERSAAAMLQIAKASYHLGRIELAQSILAQVVAISPDIAEVYFMRGLIALSDKNKADAIAQFEIAIQKNPYYVEAINNLAVQFILSGNYGPAVEKLEAAIAIAPSWATLHLNYGNALRGAGRWQDAKNALEKAGNMDSGMIAALFNLGVLYQSADQLDGLDRLARLRQSRQLFGQYKNEAGPSLSADDPVHKYLKEVSVMVEREEQRILQEKEQAEAEAKRAAERKADEGSEKPKDGEKPNDKPVESGEEEGWE